MADKYKVPSIGGGLTTHPYYGAWRQMMNRCYDERHQSYYNYGARGIIVCEEWHEFSVYLDYLNGNLGPKPPKHTLDRINNDGNYEPGNVRWASQSVQNGNQRTRPMPGYPIGKYGYRGVHFHKKAGRWNARYREKSYGYYDTVEEAARAYDKAAFEDIGERAGLNFPEEWL